MAVNASRKRACVVSSMRLIASLVCAIESTRSLRCVVRNTWRSSSSSNCSMAIMLTGPSRSIFAAARRWLLRRSSRSARRLSVNAATGDGFVSSLVLRLGSGSSARWRRRPAWPARSAPSARPRASTSSSVAWTASTHVCARWVRSLSAVARATSSSPASARMPSSARRASRIAVLRVGWLERGRRVVGFAQIPAHRLERWTSSSSARSPSAIAAMSASRGRASAAARRRARDRRVLELAAPSSSRSTSAATRRRALDQRGMRARASAGLAAPACDGLARLGEPPLRLAEPLLRCRCCSSSRDRSAPRPRPRLERRRLFLGLAAFEGDHVALRDRRALPRRRAPAARRARRSPSPAVLLGLQTRQWPPSPAQSLLEPRDASARTRQRVALARRARAAP